MPIVTGLVVCSKVEMRIEFSVVLCDYKCKLNWVDFVNKYIDRKNKIEINMISVYQNKKNIIIVVK
jgi:hypothetical protein